MVTCQGVSNYPRCLFFTDQARPSRTGNVRGKLMVDAHAAERALGKGREIATKHFSKPKTFIQSLIS